jgi:hypothetical protein
MDLRASGASECSCSCSWPCRRLPTERCDELHLSAAVGGDISQAHDRTLPSCPNLYPETQQPKIIPTGSVLLCEIRMRLESHKSPSRHITPTRQLAPSGLEPEQTEAASAHCTIARHWQRLARHMQHRRGTPRPPNHMRLIRCWALEVRCEISDLAARTPAESVSPRSE